MGKGWGERKSPGDQGVKPPLTSLPCPLSISYKAELSRRLRAHLCMSVWWLLSHERLFVTPWTRAHQVPLSMEFSRQGYWNGLPFPSPGDLPDPGIEPTSPALHMDSLPSEPLGKPQGPPLRCHNPNKKSQCLPAFTCTLRCMFEMRILLEWSSPKST